MFLHVSVCPRGLSASLHARIHIPRADTPLWADTPLAGTPLTETPWADTTMGRHTPPPLADTPWADTPALRSACWDTVNNRAVRILLECNLVYFCGWK